jgi:ribosomal-protein-alanine N-acetyltransferase
MTYLSVADADALASLHARCFARPWSADDFRRFSGWPPYFGLVVWHESTAIGFILSSMAGGQSDIVSIGVDPAFRRRGIASALIEQLLSDAARLGVETLFLEVETGNEGAIALYRRHGFEIAGRRPAYYDSPAGPLDALVMRLGLSGDAASHTRLSNRPPLF